MEPEHSPASIVCDQIDETRTAIVAARRDGKTVGIVPTMGALHEGHMSLVDAAREQCDLVVATIFVNPTQFGAGEDFDAYPRDLTSDVDALRRRGVWLVFAPSVDAMYGAGHQTFVEVGDVASPWEGAARPIHFRGVSTIVLKLFLIAPADRAYFGQKDYQQTLVVSRMVEDLNVPIEICVCPTVRESDGLALSSRNVYLDVSQRRQALALWQALKLGEQLRLDGETNAAEIRRRMLALIDGAGGVEVEYLAILEEGTVRELEVLDRPAVAVVAAHVGPTRLIDNHRIG
ncbi:MAG: pantoate--beta-alanine ligase [Planctomycetota bacterium]